MNESQFESSLRAFLPLTPPAAVEERIGAALFQPEPSPAKKEREPVSIRFEQAREPWLIRCFHNLGWAVAGAASAMAAIALYPAKPAPEKHETRAVQIATVPMSARIERRDASEKRIPMVDRSLSSPASSVADSSATRVSTVPISASLPAGSGDTGDFQALETTRELVSTEEEDQVVYRNGNTPMRQVRTRYREHHSWANPRTGARVDIEVPREDVFLKPVSLQ